MRLKVYQAPNIGAAMMLVRDELGPDALILASRSIDGAVEVTAAHESIPASVPVLNGDQDTALHWHGVPAKISEKLLCADMITSLPRVFSFGELCCRSADPPLLIVGPPGAGKTTTVARLATRMRLAGQTTHVITADGRRAGAAEQLAAFTRLLGLTLLAADTPEQLSRAVSRNPHTAPVLIDMPGLSPFDPADRDYLQACRAAAGATVVLVLPAGLDPAEAEEIAAAYRALGATLLVATRLDQSRRLGGILAAAAQGLTLTEAGIGPGIADGVTMMSPAFLAARLVQGAKSPLVPAFVPSPLDPPSPLAQNVAELPRAMQ